HVERSGPRYPDRHRGGGDREVAGVGARRVVDSHGVGTPLAVHGDVGQEGVQVTAAERSDVDGVVAVPALDRDGVGRRVDDQFVVLVAEVDAHAGRRHLAGVEENGVRPAAAGAGDTDDVDLLGGVLDEVTGDAGRHEEVVGDAAPGGVGQHAVDDLESGRHP